MNMGKGMKHKGKMIVLVGNSFKALTLHMIELLTLKYSTKSLVSMVSKDLFIFSKYYRGLTMSLI